MKGVGLGILEGAAETIDADMARLKKTQAAMINHHMTRELLSSLTGEPDRELALEQAAQLFKAVGNDTAQAKELFKTVQNAQAMNPEYDVNQAFTFIGANSDMPLRTKQEIVQSFATGKRGAYDPQVTSIEVPGILGKITGPKDVSKQIKSNLSALGIPNGQSASDPAPTLGQATIKRAYLDPVAALEWQKSKTGVAQAEANLTSTQILNERDQYILDNLDEKTKLELQSKRIQIKNAITTGKQANFDFVLSKEYGRKEKELNIRLTEASILAKGPKDLEEYSVQLISQIDALNKRLADTGNNPTERQIINEGIGVFSASLQRVTQSMSQDAKMKVRDKVNPVAMYNNFFNVALSARGVDYKTQNIEGVITARIEGVSAQKYLARLDAATSFKEVFGASPLSRQYAQQAQQELNTLMTGKTAESLFNNKTLVAPQQITAKTKLIPGQIYDVSQAQSMIPGPDGQLKPFSVADQLTARGYTLVSGKFAMWIGNDFRSVRQ